MTMLQVQNTLNWQRILDDEENLYEELELDSERLFSIGKTKIRAGAETGSLLITDEETLGSYLKARLRSYLPYDYC
jgi:hypothetical protein